MKCTNRPALRRIAILALLALALAPLGARAENTGHGGGGVFGRANDDECYPAPAQVCKMLPVHARLPLDMNVFAVATLFTPDKLDVRLGGTLYFQNLDGQDHTVTSLGCVRAGVGACMFDKPLYVGYTGLSAVKIAISTHDFDSGKTYDFVCRVHPFSMKGTFTVH
jgi:plastocyanin